jgi:AAA+ superfamily predicted ATPase
MNKNNLAEKLLAEAEAKILSRYFDWLQIVIEGRKALQEGNELPPEKLDLLFPPQIPASSGSALSNFFLKHDLGFPDQVVLLLALATELQPDIFTEISKNHPNDPSTGLVQGDILGDKLPTLRTAVFLIGGYDPSISGLVSQMFDTDHPFIKNHVLYLQKLSGNTSFYSSIIHITPEYLHLFTTGEELKPRFSSEFPAKRMQTTLEWDDLVLSGDARKQVAEIKLWLQHKEAFLGEWEMSRKFKPGYSALFHGPPGTGKTMTASLLGKATGRDVYRIDLSSVISKYIGETEKNLARIFDLAENKEWILFFDEADSLFGKRGKVSDARDRYANQDISFLLQRLEDFNGLSILASNLKSNIDEAFMRRFQAIIYFPLPNPEMRYQLWKQAIPKRAKLERKVKILELAHKYELTGAAIMNVVRHATLKTIDGGDEIMREEYLMEGIKREYFKVGKVV